MKQTNLKDQQRNLLSYLGRIPAKLAKSETKCPQARRLLAEVALDVGNCLLWIVEPGAPRVEQPLNESAQSVWALGKQFRAVGLALWDSPDVAPSDVERLAHEVASMARELERLRTATMARSGFASMRDAVDAVGEGEAL